MVTILTQFGEDRCMQFRVVVVTDLQTHAARPLKTRPQTGPMTFTAPLSLARSANRLNYYAFGPIGRRH